MHTQPTRRAHLTKNNKYLILKRHIAQWPGAMFDETEENTLFHITKSSAGLYGTRRREPFLPFPTLPITI